MQRFLGSILTLCKRCGLLAAFGLLLASGTAQAVYNPDTPDSSGSIIADGLLIYYAVVPAGMMRQFPRTSPERRMHGGVPHGPHWHHVMVALFDKATNERISDATVRADITDLGFATEKVVLERSAAGGAETYMNYFQFDQSGIYTIELTITPESGGVPVTAEFRYRHH